MVPTIPWMRENFQKYNDKYFGGELPTPSFSVRKMPNEWGRFELTGARFSYATRKITRRDNNGILLLTSSFDRKEDAIISTLLHEMVHEYVYCVMGVYPKDTHGKEFMSIASKINADGWNIADGVSKTKDDVEANKEQGQTAILFVVYDEKAHNSWQVGRAEEKDIESFKESAKKIGAKIWFYSVLSRNFMGIQTDPSVLLGFKGISYQDAVAKMAKYCGEKAAVFSVNNMEAMK